jgi:hypothetical protein
MRTQTPAVTEQFAEPNRHGRRNRFALAQNIVEMLAGDAEQVGNFGFGPAGGWNHILPQQSAGMLRYSRSGFYCFR